MFTLCILVDQVEILLSSAYSFAVPCSSFPFIVIRAFLAAYLRQGSNHDWTMWPHFIIIIIVVVVEIIIIIITNHHYFYEIFHLRRS